MKNDLTSGDIKIHLRNIAIPSSIGYFFHTMFNVTDTYFAGNISTVALAALSLTFSIFFLIIAIAGGMSQAITALIGNALGNKDIKYAQEIMIHSAVFGAVLSILLTVGGIVISPYLLKILGAKGIYLQKALAYIDTILLGVIFFIGVFFINAILNSIGNTKAYRNFLVTGFFANTILDYLFIKGGFGLPSLGITGIALATILIEFAGVIYLFFELKKTTLTKNFPKFTFDIKIIISLLKQGVPSTINLTLMALGMFIITYYISHFGKDVVAAYGIAIRIEQIVLLPGIGINVAVLSLVSQNFGACKFNRIKDVLVYAYKIAFVLWLGGMLFLYMFGANIMQYFTSDKNVIEAGLGYLYATATALYAYMTVFINVSLLQGIKKPVFLIFLSIFRQVLFPIFLFSIFLYFKFSLKFYWWGMVFTIWLSALLAYVYAKRKLLESIPEAEKSTSE